jgi:hypothetical protein
MSTWTEEELKRIAGTDDLHISPFRKTLVASPRLVSRRMSAFTRWRV